MDSHQDSHQSQLTLTGTPLTFNPASKFLDVTVDRTLSFGSYVHSLRFKALNPYITSASWGSSKDSLSHLYKAFIWPVFSTPLRGGFLFSAIHWKKDLKVYHRSACRVISGCFASTPVPDAASGIAHSPSPLKITLNNHALAFYERALRLSADNFPL